MVDTPTNLWRLIAKHQVKFIHWRTITDLEEDINKRLTAAIGKYEVKEIKLDLSQTWALMWVIHYYEQTRLVDADSKNKWSLKTTTTVVGAETTARKRSVSIEWGTKHVAPSLTTPETHNKKQETVQVKPDVHSINNELDKMTAVPTPPTKDEETPVKDEVVVEEKKKTKLPEGYEVAPTAEIAAEPTPESEPETVDDVDDVLKEDTRGDLTQEEIDNG